MSRRWTHDELMAAWVKNTKGLIQDNRQQLELLESGKMKLRKRVLGTPWRDTTLEEIGNLKRIIGELEALVARHLTLYPHHA